MFIRSSFIFLSMVLILVSCSSRKSGFNTTDINAVLSEQERNQTLKKAELAWAKRDQKEQLEAAIADWEKLSHSVNGDQIDILTRLAQAYYLLGDAHEENIDVKKALFEKGAVFGEKAMSTNNTFSKKIKDGDSVEKSLSSLERREIGAMYWTAANLGKWSKASGILEQLKYKTRIKALIERVEKVDARYFYSAPSRYWGAFYSLAPSFAGGDLKKSLKYFEKSISEAPQYLGTKVLMADTYYIKTNDKTNFKKILEEVLATSDEIEKDLIPENRLEKKKARKLLDKMDQIF